MQRKLHKHNHSTLFMSKLASAGSKGGAIVGGGIGTSVALYVALAGTHDKKMTPVESALLVGLGLAAGVTGGYVIGGVGGGR